MAEAAKHNQVVAWFALLFAPVVLRLIITRVIKVVVPLELDFDIEAFLLLLLAWQKVHTSVRTLLTKESKKRSNR